MWFSNTGILIPGLGFHFIAKLTGMDERMPRYLYPYVFYLPALFPLFSIFGAQEMISAQRFAEIGMWKQPVYNASYYAALVVSTSVSLLYLFPLLKARIRAASAEMKSLYTLTVWGVVVTALWIVAFGLFKYGSFMPPYPYIYCGLLWCFVLRLTMRRHDFLNFADKRYEKLFHLNPAAILLLDRSGAVREANPAAEQLIGDMCEDREAFYSLVKGVVRERVRAAREIKDYEATVQGASRRLDVLLDGDFITVDNEPHIILIVRDVTAQREYQEEIRYLAYHDPLTRLPNRRYFYERLESTVAEAKRQDSLVGIVLIDLDYFKDINDKYGHKAGDEALLHTSRLLREAVAERGAGGETRRRRIRAASPRADVGRGARRDDPASARVRRRQPAHLRRPGDPHRDEHRRKPLSAGRHGRRRVDARRGQGDVRGEAAQPQRLRAGGAAVGGFV
ncbi:GGDEF domain-containing protein [Cohnella rhizosphaerae]|uniref:Diguanylate cyclase n=1 Tax=Cohnella rhizosphaerae TaxID=1457232 RepID=A0A9X4KS95_9BACL|nr:diguanylate cyclase [Cohnella rhizosphaerae]MDG0810214.1 diguanylate cyclase [Cohnella rhizosphaerae]